MKYFCTYFDKNFLIRGLALYESLIQNCPDFKLFVLCFDDETFSLLQKMNLENLELISLSDFEDPELLRVKNTRTNVEYFWTCTPSLSLYVLKKNPQINMVAYLDADMYFYTSPEAIYTEFGQNSIMIIPHNYSPDQKSKEKTSGIYNVGMLIFRNDKNGLDCLNWWRDRCIEWCFDRYEDGKFGDQVYLNDWPNRFEGVYVLKNLGVNVASWNIKNFLNDAYNWPLLFYHFHGLKIYLSKNKIKFYPIQILDVSIYETYRKAIDAAYRKILSLDPNWKYGFVKKLGFLRYIKQSLIK